ncbi:MAG: hypothetical protein ACYDA1_05555 [Vulcanimicrobiaceae bacterium]
MKPVSPKWQRGGLVLVCERCSKERIPEETPEVAARLGDFHLRDWLKSELKARGAWGPIRAVSTSCLDVCAKGCVTICIDPQNANAVSEILIVDPLADRDALYTRIIEKLS